MERSKLFAHPNRLAVVGIAFRFPGPAGEGFWSALREGRNLVGSVHESRWPAQSFHHPRKNEPGATYTTAGGSLGDVSGFDAAFFGISPREAAQLDPQQRLLLELTWEAFESGAIRPGAVRGSRASVYIGFSGSDYAHRCTHDLGSVHAFSMTGVTGSIAANRISYFFDLRGPSMAVDTACSSSLVALHQACQSILSGEAELAVAGAVSLHLHPLAYIAFSKAGMLSERGLCTPFDASADGYVRSEGAAIVLLKRLDDALAAGQRIFAVVAGSAVNSDGKTSALTVPSGEAQACLLREAYARAGIEPSQIDYLEAHGTGTAVGDPIEARALGEVLGRRRDPGSPLRIGSVKSNLGHLETASGMAGVVKAIYCLRERVIPPSINFRTPNPQIPFAEWNLQVVTENTPLDPDKRLVIGVNSFGFGGANAHVILESWRSAEPATGEDRPAPLIISARSEQALKAAAGRYAQWLRERGDLRCYDIAYSAAFHRDWLEHRAIAFDPDRARLAGALSAFAEGRNVPGVVAGRALGKAPPPVFVYSGNGSQWAGMGRKLLAGSAVFRDAVAAVDACFTQHGDFSLLGALREEDIGELLEATEHAQPLLFAVQVGITELLRDRGIHPASVVGHSVGEVAAAWACGALSLEQAATVIFERSRWQGKTRGSGAMMAVALGEAQARALLARSAAGGRLAIAAVNSPSSLTVAGPRDELELLAGELAKRDVSYRKLALDYAFHSALMDPVEQALKSALADLRPGPERLPFYSATRGGRTAGEQLDAAYWWRNIREPVQFSRAVGQLVGEGASVFVEIGPQPVLRSHLQECLRAQSAEGRALPTMTRSADDAEALQEKAFEVLVAGCTTDLARLFPEKGRQVELPTYPWQRERHWYALSPEGYDLADRRIEHPLLGYRLANAAWEWQSELDTCRFPALADHVVGAETLLPGAAFAEMALAAAQALRGSGPQELHDLDIRAPLALHQQHSMSVRLSAEAADGRFTICSRERLKSDPWLMHASGRLSSGLAQACVPARLDPAPGAERLAGDVHYRLTASLGLQYGPAFRLVEELWHDGEAVLARLKPAPAIGRGASAMLHLASLDACFQLLVHALREGAREGFALVPVKIEHLVLHRPQQTARFARMQPTRRSRRSVVADCALYDEAGEPIATLRGVRFAAVQLKKPAGAGLTFLASHSFAKALPHQARAPLPSLDRLAEVCRARLHAAERIQARERYFADIEPLLEAMLTAFAGQALQAAPELAPERQALRERLEELVGDGDYPDAREIWAQLLGEHPDHAHEVIWLGQAGAQLGALLKGAAWTGKGPPQAPLLAAAIAEVAAEAMRNLPAQRRLRVLAVDAAQTACLALLLDQLDLQRCDCVVLCAEPSVIEDRKALAARYSGTRVHALDLGAATLELPPELTEPFDLVIAEEGLGWAQELEPLLQRLYSLTAPQGLLVLGEQRPSRAVALACELLYLAGAERSALRVPSGAPAEHRQLVLERCGFADIRIIADAPEVDSGAHLILARAEKAARPPEHATRWILITDREGYSARLGAELEARMRALGAQVQVLHEPPSPSAEARIDGVVQLAGLGAPLEQQGARCVALARLLEVLAALPAPATLWIVTARSHALAEEAPLWGFGRSAINEYPGLALRLADLAEPEALPQMADALAAAVLQADAEDEILLTRTERYAVRLQPSAPFARQASAPGAIARLELAAAGQMKNLCWTRRPRVAPAEDEVEIEVHAAGLNFRDVMLAGGQLPEEALENGFVGATLGMELSGVVAAAGGRVSGLRPGDSVIAFAPSSFATRALTKAAAVIRKPAGWSFEAAATVPAAFLTAYYAIHQLARLEEGQSILIHGAAGGVGIAAIQIAQMAGAEVFATVGSQPKREFLRLLGVEHVLDSRSLGFADEVMRRTSGGGVDVVLNSLAGEAMDRSLRVLKPFGRFLELGKRDFYEDTRIGLRPMRNNITYFAIDADQLMLERPELARRLLQELMALFRQGRLKPLPYRAFAAADAVEAFRYMQQSKQIGKVVLCFDPPPAAEEPAAAPAGRLALVADATYLVTGGLRGFGLRTAQWLAERGARHLVLVGRSGALDADATAALAALRARGVELRIAKCDVADRGALEALLAETAAAMPPLRGVVHAAAVIRDGLIRNLDSADLEAVFAPKVRGGANLDALTRHLELDFFVLYSSATTCFGNPGQASYVAANRYLEVLAAARRAAGLPALCVAWGPIADAGYLARHKQLKEVMEARMGGRAIMAEDALGVLEQLMLADVSGLAVARFERGRAPRMLAALASPKFQPLLARFAQGEPAAADEDLQQWLAELDDEELEPLFVEIVKKEIAEILRMPAERLDARQPLQELGLDSLMGVELVTAIEARFGIDIPPMALGEASSIERLVKRIIRELRRARQAEAQAPEAGIAEQVRLAAAQHAPQVDAHQVEAFAEGFKVTAK